jgi:hypothetical protein
MSDPMNPAQRKAEAREVLDKALTEEGRARTLLGMSKMMEFGEDYVRRDVAAVNLATLESKAAIDAYARACIDEAVAPALEYIDHCIELHKENCNNPILLECVRKLLTERAVR